MSPYRQAPIVFALLAMLVSSALSQTPEEHEKHHPKGQETPEKKSPGGMMGGAGMGDMMKNMGVPPPREIYPELMESRALSPEKRVALEAKAHERMKSGTTLLSEGLEKLALHAPTDDYKAMEQAVAVMREGINEFKSGLAAHRLLAEGKAPRSVALQWFKREMNLSPSTVDHSNIGPFGFSWFHFFVMLLLGVFSAAMIGMYFHKMRRATHLIAQFSNYPSRASAVDGAPSPPVPVARPGKWSGVLRVAKCFDETPGVRTFRLAHPETGSLPFSFAAGQFITVTATVDGEKVKRSYTIASSPTRDYAEITVKREEKGRVSSYLHTELKAGSEIDVAGPSGRFTFDGSEATRIVLIAGGVGVTPMMSVIRYLTDRAWPGEISLLYSARSQKDIIFREELKYLAGRYANLKIIFTLTNERSKSWKGARGRLSKELLTSSVPNLSSCRVHICGPDGMMTAVVSMLVDLKVAESAIHKEAFGAAKAQPRPVPAASPEGHSARFSLSKKSGLVAPETTLLDLADEIGVPIESSCRAGTCGVCMVKLSEGEVSMEIDDALSDSDRNDGMILACQAKAKTDVTVEA